MCLPGADCSQWLRKIFLNYSSKEIAPHISELLVQGEWSEAKDLADKSRQELIEQGYFPDGIKLAVGENWAKGHGKFK